MNLELFNKLMEQGSPHQHLPEWQTFLEICEAYLKTHEIKNYILNLPQSIVVELGIERNGQKKFYERLLGAKHIGIDIKNRNCIPDIHGDTHDPETLEALKKKLNGKPINILFIDASHHYEDVKKDFEMYSPLCTDIVAFHDIETYRYGSGKERGVSIFWDELKKTASTELGKYRNFLFLSIHQRTFLDKCKQMGIGMIIKK